MELKKIFPKWWHPAIPTGILILLGYIGSQVPPIEEEPIGILGEIVVAALIYSIFYIGFAFWKTGYLVVKDIYNTVIK